jgi:hypothetical protein
MKKGLVCAALLAAVAGGSYVVVIGQTNSGASHVRADMNGYQENVSVFTTGRGQLTAKIDDDAMTIEYELSYSGLEGGAASASHIHFGARDNNGGVSAFLCGGGDKPPCPPTEGTVTGVIDAADVIGPAGQGIEAGRFDKLVEAIRAGHTYANVHTPRWPGGEIRGQIRNNSQREFDR